LIKRISQPGDSRPEKAGSYERVRISLSRRSLVGVEVTGEIINFTFCMIFLFG